MPALERGSRGLALVGAEHAAETLTTYTLGFKSFRAARATVMGIELVHMIRKGQVRPLDSGSDAQQFYAVAA